MILGGVALTFDIHRSAYGEVHYRWDILSALDTRGRESRRQRQDLCDWLPVFGLVVIIQCTQPWERGL